MREYYSYTEVYNKRSLVEGVGMETNLYGVG